MDLLGEWRHRLAKGWVCRSLTWSGEPEDQARVAKQLAERRLVRAIPRPLEEEFFPRGVAAVEWRAALGTRAREA